MSTDQLKSRSGNSFGATRDHKKRKMVSHCEDIMTYIARDDTEVTLNTQRGRTR